MILMLKCPKCGNKMKYQPNGLVSEKKVKRCVYCGYSMKVRKCILKKVE